LRLNDGGRSPEAGFLAQCVQKFRQAMSDWAVANGIAGGWEKSAQLCELLALAKPITERGAGRHLFLEHPTGGTNEFVEAKKLGLALPSVSRWKGQRPREVAAVSGARLASAGGGPRLAPQPAVVPVPPPAPTEVVVDSLLYSPGQGEWRAAVLVAGRRIQVIARGELAGVTPEEKTRRRTGRLTCVVEPLGGPNYRIVAVKR